MNINDKNVPLLLFPVGVQKLLGIKSTQFYEFKKLPGFPKPKDVHGKTKMYSSLEIIEWVNNLKNMEDPSDE